MATIKSIEEKAKAYDELKVKAQELTEDGYIDKLALLDLFPELKESIDERIKKVIKQILSESTTEKDECYLDNGVTQQEVFAWLEKQGEQKPAWSKEDESILFCTISDLKFLRDIISKDPKYAVNIIDIEREINWLKSLKDRVQPQIKQEWSEEDAKTFNRISTILVDASKVKNWWKEYRLIERDEMIRLTDFLKSIKDRYA